MSSAFRKYCIKTIPSPYFYSSPLSIDQIYWLSSPNISISLFSWVFFALVFHCTCPCHLLPSISTVVPPQGNNTSMLSSVPDPSISSSFIFIVYFNWVASPTTLSTHLASPGSRTISSIANIVTCHLPKAIYSCSLLMFVIFAVLIVCLHSSSDQLPLLYCSTPENSDTKGPCPTVSQPISNISWGFSWFPLLFWNANSPMSPCTSHSCTFLIIEPGVDNLVDFLCFSTHLISKQRNLFVPCSLPVRPKQSAAWVWLAVICVFSQSSNLHGAHQKMVGIALYNVAVWRCHNASLLEANMIHKLCWFFYYSFWGVCLFWYKNSWIVITLYQDPDASIQVIFVLKSIGFWVMIRLIHTKFIFQDKNKYNINFTIY